MPDITQPQTPPPTMYAMSASQIAWRNFLAGFMHGLGGFVITILTWVVLYVLFIRLVFPQISGFMNQATQFMDVLENISQPQTQQRQPPAIQIPSGVYDQLQQLQQP